MKFKTNAKCEGCRGAILDAMNKLYPDAEWKMDLDSADKILEVHGIPEDAEHARRIETTLEQTGFRGSWIPAASAY